jgi:hypothetical protein
MSGSLRGDLFADLLACEEGADLVLAVGTSLCGMNSDRLVSSAAYRARLAREARDGTPPGSCGTARRAVKKPAALSCCGVAASAAVQMKESTTPEWPGSPRVAEAEAAEMVAAAAAVTAATAEDAEATVAIEARLAGLEALGSVIVSLQRTVHDENSSLRIFALLDDVFVLLAAELSLDLAAPAASHTAAAEARAAAGGGGDTKDVRHVPYDRATGLPLAKEGKAAAMAAGFVLDLREESALVVAAGPDQGAKATVVGKNADGHWRVSVERRMKSGKAFFETRLLGSWWLEAAARGDVSQLPVVPDPAEPAPVC